MHSGPLYDLVDDIIADQLRQGPTTLAAIRAAGVTAIMRGGGPLKFGFGDAYIYQFVGEHVADVAKQLLKGGLYIDDSAQLRINAPPLLAEQLLKIPRAIALGEGRDAEWVSSLRATAEQWKTNANLKAKKAQQTIKQADESMDVANYLTKYGMTCLGEGLADMSEEAA
jgi:hypothetical protein